MALIISDIFFCAEINVARWFLASLGRMINRSASWQICLVLRCLKKQTGKGGFGKYFDPDDLLPAALAVPQTTGGEKDHSRILDAVGSGDDFLLSGKYHGSVAGLYADGSGRDLRSCLL